VDAVGLRAERRMLQGLADEGADLRKGDGVFLQRLEGPLQHLPGDLAGAAAARGDDYFLGGGHFHIGVYGNAALRADQDLFNLFRPLDIALAEQEAGPELFQADRQDHRGADGFIVQGYTVGRLDRQMFFLLAYPLRGHDGSGLA